MNKFANEIILSFLSPRNKLDLAKRMRIMDNENLLRSMITFSKLIESEINYSDALPGSTFETELNYFNNKFIQIHSDELSQGPIAFTIADSAQIKNDTKSPGALLHSWRNYGRTGAQLRDDSSGATGTAQIIREGATDGITFCDQREVSVNSHLDHYENTFYKRALNKSKGAVIGDGSQLSNTRLFNKNEAGEENGILRHRVRAQRRNLDRDITENLRATEKDCIAKGYLTTNMFQRIH